MNLKLQNILKIESADIRLGGLTVITGENDTGKSTVGKILFTILKKDIMSGISSIETRYWECRDFDSNLAKL